MIDTHTHIQFKIFDQDRDEVIKRAVAAGVEKIIAVGTDIESSKKAVEIAQQYTEVYAAVGIHPHHVFSYQSSDIRLQHESEILKKLIQFPKVVAIGETGLDSHLYPSTKYLDYKITEEFLKLQKLVFTQQINLAKKYQKTLVIHNRGQVEELLQTLEENWDPFFEGRAVFHCCEPDERMLEFAVKHQVFIGVDGDVTYDKAKQAFAKRIPVDLLVLETDSPFFVPEPLKSNNLKTNTPANLPLIAKFLSKLMGQNVQIMSRNNASVLFKLDS